MNGLPRVDRWCQMAATLRLRAVGPPPDPAPGPRWRRRRSIDATEPTAGAPHAKAEVPAETLLPAICRLVAKHSAEATRPIGPRLRGRHAVGYSRGESHVLRSAPAWAVHAALLLAEARGLIVLQDTPRGPRFRVTAEGRALINGGATRCGYEK